MAGNVLRIGLVRTFKDISQKLRTKRSDEILRPKRDIAHIGLMRCNRQCFSRYLKNYQRSSRLKQLFAQMQLPPPPPKVNIPIRVSIFEKTGNDITKCPKCKTGILETIATYRNGFLCKSYEPKKIYTPFSEIKNKASP
jgi:hypothetical protein